MDPDLSEKSMASALHSLKSHGRARHAQTAFHTEHCNKHYIVWALARISNPGGLQACSRETPRNERERHKKERN